MAAGQGTWRLWIDSIVISVLSASKRDASRDTWGERSPGLGPGIYSRYVLADSWSGVHLDRNDTQ